MRTRNRVTLAIALAIGSFPLIGSTPAAPALPRLDLAHFLPAIRQQVQRAYAAARAHPSDAAATGKLGMVLDTYEQYESASVCYQRARRLEPGSFRWVYYLGSVQAAQGKYREAAGTLAEALRLNSDYLPTQLKLAESFLAAGDFEESGKVYEAVLKKHADAAAAHYGMGRVCAARGDEAAATESYGKACELFPAYGTAHYALALAYRKRGDTPKSREHFSLYEQNVTTVPPLDDPLRHAVIDLNLGAAPHVRRGVALEEAGKIEEAIAEHEKALQIDAKSVQAHINLISLYGRLGQTAKAEQHYRASVSLSPNRADAYYNHGVLLFGQHKYPEAEEAFRKALEINPFYAEAYNNLGYLFERQGRLEEARRQFEEAIQNQPEYRLAHFHLGRILVNEKKYDEAIQHFLKTLEPDDENTPGYLYALAATYARAGDRPSALKYARRARDEAGARGQTQLLASIERDLQTLEQEKNPR